MNEPKDLRKSVSRRGDRSRRVVDRKADPKPGELPLELDKSSSRTEMIAPPVNKTPLGITKTTLADLTFAESYLEYVSRKSRPPERARAKMLLAAMQMLDVDHPTWRVDLLEKMAQLGIDRNAEDIFPLPEVDTSKLFEEFMNTILTRK